MTIHVLPEPTRGYRRRASYRDTGSRIFTEYGHPATPSRRARRFIEAECRVPIGRGEGELYSLRPVHRRWLRESFDSGALATIISGPRGMGKTGWMAAVAVWALFDRPGSQIIIAGTSQRVAGHTYNRAVRIIEANPELAAEAMVYRNKADPWTELPVRGSSLRPIPAEERYIVGYAPDLILIDEVGYVSRETWETMQTSLGKTEDAKLVAFGTPGLGVVDSDAAPNQMWALRQAYRSASPPPGLNYVEHAADLSDDPGSVKTWRKANPLIGDLVEKDAVKLDHATMPAARFGQMRLGLWTQHESAWMPVDAWERLAIDSEPWELGTPITLGFDGSIRRDSSALVAYDLSRPRLRVLGHWEGNGTPIPRAEVMATIDRAFTDYRVSRLYADPWYWREALEELAARLGEERVVEWNSASIARMGPASDAFLEAVMRGELAWDGHEALRAAVLNAVAKRTPAGDVIARDARRPRDTDAAVAAILAYEAGRTWEAPPRPFIY